MRLEDQVISLDIAKKLKEIGLKQESYYVWRYYQNEIELTTLKAVKIFNKYSHDSYPAYTLSELLDILPSTIYTNEDEEHLSPDTSYQLWVVKVNDIENPYVVSYYSNKDHNSDDWQQENDTLPNCLAKMLIYLIEIGKVKL